MSSARARSCCGRRGGTTPRCARWSGGSRSGSGAVGAVRHRRATAAAARRAASVRVALLPSTAQEAAFVAHALRSAHVERGRAVGARWPSIARSGAQVTALRRALGGRVRAGERARQRRAAARRARGRGRCSRPCGSASARRSSTPATAARLACSPLGGLDAVGLRRVRRALRAHELAEGGGRTSDALLVEALAVATTEALPPSAARPVARLARVLAAGRAAAARRRVPMRRPCCGRCGTPPSRPSRGAGPRSPVARRVSGPTATSTPCSRCSARPRRSSTGCRARRPAAFVDWLQAQDLPSDSLAARARRASRAGAHAGRRGRAGVGGRRRRGRAGRARGPTCGCATRCSARRRSSTSSPDARAGTSPTPAATPPRRAQAVLADELRSFAVACSRARRSLLVTAVDDVDHQPSPFLDLVDAVRRRGRRPAADQRARAARPARARRAAAGAPRAGGRRRRRARPGGGAHARAAGGRRRRRCRPGAVATVSPRRRATRPLWAAGRARAGLAVEGRDRAAVRAAVGPRGGGRHGVARAAARTSARCCTRSPRSTRRAPRRSCRRRSTGAGASSGSGTGWPALATRRKADAMVHRLAVYLRTAGEPLLVEGAFSARHRPGDAARHGRPRSSVDDAATGRWCASST